MTAMSIEELLEAVKSIAGVRQMPQHLTIELLEAVENFELTNPLEYSEFRFNAVLDISNTRYDLNVPDLKDRIKRIKVIMENDEDLETELNSRADILAEQLFDELSDTDDVD